MIDLISFLFLIINFFTFGTPQNVEYKTVVSLEIQYDQGINLNIGLKLDPLLVYYINDSNKNYCGLFMYNAIIINEAKKNYCINNLQHELNHWQQRQAVGPFMLLGSIFSCPTNPYDIDRIWCASPGYTDKNMLLPKGLNYPLIEIRIPLIWERSK